MSKRFLPCLAITACLLLSTLFAGCAGTQGSAGTQAPRASAQAASEKSAAPSAAGAAAEGGLSDAFTTVEKNPLDESIQYELWLAAKAPDATASPEENSASAIKKYADTYQALVRDKGIHYVEVDGMMGMKTEYWIKGGKFSKWIPALNEMTVFDGESYVQYDTQEKTGKRFTKEIMASDIAITVNGLLSTLTAAPYQQQKDEKIGKYSCAVFFMDMDILGMKGNTLYIDKETGMIVKNQYGDPKDKKKSMAVTVDSFESGGFGDDVFTVPADITVTEG